MSNTVSQSNGGIPQPKEIVALVLCKPRAITVYESASLFDLLSKTDHKAIEAQRPKYAPFVDYLTQFLKQKKLPFGEKGRVTQVQDRFELGGQIPGDERGSSRITNIFDTEDSVEIFFTNDLGDRAVVHHKITIPMANIEQVMSILEPSHYQQLVDEYIADMTGEDEPEPGDGEPGEEEEDEPPSSPNGPVPPSPLASPPSPIESEQQ
jgi:hypothetical protein